MRFVAGILLVIGIASITATCQQPAPPQNPPSAAPEQTAPAQTAPAQTAPAQTPSGTTENPAQSPSQPSQQNSTQPVIPTPPPKTGTPDPNLPEKDRLESELSRIQAQQEKVAIREKVQSRLYDSRSVLKELMSGRMPIPSALLQKAKCVIVIPAQKRAAFAVGVKYGRGVMTCRLGDDFNGPWSAPAMYAMEGGNFGFQIGLAGTDLVLLIMNARGVDSLLGSKFKLGGDGTLAAGPWGRNIDASTDLAMRAKILAFSRSHGLFAGVSLDGATLRPDNRANQILYGREISARQIVRRGDVVVSSDGAPLIQLLDETVRTASNTGVPAEGQPR